MKQILPKALCMSAALAFAGISNAQKLDINVEVNGYGGLRTVCSGDEVAFYTYVRSEIKPDKYTFSVKKGDEVLATKEITPSGTWDQYKGEWASVDPIKVYNTANLRMEVDAEGDTNSANNFISENIRVLKFTTTDLKVEITTNEGADKISWGIYNKEDSEFANAIKKGGPYTADDKNKTFTETMTLENNKCYTWNVWNDQGASNGIVFAIKDSEDNLLYEMKGDNSPFGWGVGNFEVASTTSTPDVAFEGNVSMFPNPVVDQAQVNLNLFADSDVQVQIVNQLGQVVSNEDLGTISAGKHNHFLNCEGLKQGAYTLRVISNGATITKKFMIQ